MVSVLITALVGALFGSMLGPQIDPVKDEIAVWDTVVKKVISDKEKEIEASALIDSVKAELKVRRVQCEEALERYRWIDAKYAASAEDYEAALLVLNTVWTEQESWLVDRSFALKDLMAENEWKEAVALVNTELQDQWDRLKEAQKTLKENLRKREKRAARHH